MQRKIALALKTSSPDAEPAPPRRGRGRPVASPEQRHAAHSAARDRICDAALALFDRGGIDAISMREIAKEIGVSPMMAYKYFATKDHLLQALRTAAFLELERALSAAASDDADARTRLEQILLAYLRFGLKERRSYRLMFDYWAYDNPERMREDFGDAIKRQAGPWNVLLAAVVDYFTAREVEGDALVTAHLIWAGLHGLVSLEASRKLFFGKGFEELMQPMVQAIMGGIPPGAAQNRSAVK